MKQKFAADNPRYQALLELLRTADTVWNASRSFFESWKLSPSQFNILNLLFSTTGGLSQTELSRQLIMHRSNATGLLDRLERRGLVERKDVAGDRRAYRVVLTIAGKKVMNEILPIYYESAGSVWDNLSASRAEELIADLRHAAGNAERIANPGERESS